MRIKTTFFYLLLAVSFASNIADAQQFTFSKVLYDSLQNGIQAHSIVSTADNGYIITGAASYQNGLILKVDSAGNLIWNKTFPNLVLNEIIATNDSCFVIVGTSSCMKINSNGNLLWSKSIGQGRSLCIQQTYDSGYIITGSTEENNAPNERVFVAKLDLTGNLQWTTILTGSNKSNIGYSIKQTLDSGYVITGYMENYPPYEPNAFLLKLSSSGVFLWAKKYHLVSAGLCSGNDVLITSNGFLCYLNTGNNVTLMKTDFSGNILWNKSYGYSGSINYSFPAPKLHKTYSNDYVFVSGSGSGCMGNSEVTKTDSTGNLIWKKNLNLGAVDVIESKEKELFIVGNGPLCAASMQQQVSSPQIGIIKTDSLGNGQNCVSSFSIISVIDTIISSSATFTSSPGGTENAIYPSVDSIMIVSYQGCISVVGGIHESEFNNGIFVYPNPSDGKYYVGLPEGMKGSEINIIVYNLLGEILLNTKSNNGLSQIDLSKESNGIYIIRVNDTNQSYNQRLIKLK